MAVVSQLEVDPWVRATLGALSLIVVIVTCIFLATSSNKKDVLHSFVYQLFSIIGPTEGRKGLLNEDIRKHCAVITTSPVCDLEKPDSSNIKLLSVTAEKEPMHIYSAGGDVNNVMQIRIKRCHVATQTEKTCISRAKLANVGIN